MLAALLLALQPNTAEAPVPSVQETVRHVKCGPGNGSAFVVGDDIVATANHVAIHVVKEENNCVDAATGNKFRVYFQDPDNDFALMTVDLPDVEPVKYSCGHYEAGKSYTAYGYSSYQLPSLQFPAEPHVATGKMAKIFNWDVAELKGYARPGQSGGMFVDDKTGRAIGMVNAGTLHIITGAVMGTAYSVPLRNTVLCKS